MPRLNVQRVIAADPTSTALLLAGPSALELWPGLEPVEHPGGRLHAAVPGPGSQRLEVAVHALPPLRNPTSFVSRFTVTVRGSEFDAAQVAGRLTLTYDGPRTQAALQLDGWPGPMAPLRRDATAFLDNLARAAEGRSFAA
ncbi:MAG: hypothetical protein ACYDB7_07630 [Mycobacteriales bacterium]